MPNGTNSGVEQYVNPYEYVKPTMPTELKFNERTGNGDATQVVTYTTKDTNHLLVWSFDEFRPSYNGGLIYVTAKLIGMDGNVQSYKIPFLVKRMLANNMTSAKTTKNSSGKTVLTTTSVYNSAVENSVAKTAFSIDPNDPTRLTMPFAYIVTFTVSTPEYDTSTGKIKTETVDADGKTIVRDKYNVLTDPETLEFFYAIVSMPADTSYTVKSSGITTNADGKSAIVQFADQERVSVPIEQAAKVDATAYTPNVSGLYNDSAKTLNMTTMVNSQKVNVVWFGVAEVYSSSSKTTLVARYSVTFSSAEEVFALPTSSARKIVYKLYAAIGTVVDSNGTLLTTRTAKAGESFADGTIVKEGQLVPDAQVVSSLATITING